MNKESPLISNIEKTSLILLFVFLLGSFFFRSWQISISLFWGGTIVILNFFFLRKIISSIIDKKAKVKLILFLIFKYIILMGVFILSLIFFKLELKSFLIGLSIVVVSIMINSILKIAQDGT